MLKISLDTLRYYNEIQLFNPDYINPSNNYRFYSEEQVNDLLYIIDLKECGFNLDEIKTIINLSDKTEMKKIFEKKKTDLLDQRKKINLSIDKIETSIKNII
ncbi:MAG: MerR family transcriptional regulator [Oscillospiraceae bacterium]|nr:MerR family transcriptional regulator [Oscillospiraceae bacterium]